TLPSNSAGKVYIELLGVAKPDLYDRYVPQSAAVILYLTQLPPTGVAPAGVPITNDGTGHPSDQPLFTTTNPQGFLLEDKASGSVREMQDAAEFPHTTLNDFMPNAKSFPPRTESTLPPGGGA